MHCVWKDRKGKVDIISAVIIKRKERGEKQKRGDTRIKGERWGRVMVVGWLGCVGGCLRVVTGVLLLSLETRDNVLSNDYVV